MAKLIIIDTKQIKASLARFRKFLAHNPTERARLEGPHQCDKAGDESVLEQTRGAETLTDESETGR